MPGTPRYRGLRRTASRQALLDAAEELIGRRGFAGVSVDEITARAGVAKGTFYNHFADKADVANLIARGIRDELRALIGPMKAVSSDPAHHLAIAMRMFWRLAVEQPNRALILVLLINDPTDVNSPMNAPVRQTLLNGEASGRFSFASIEAALIAVIGIVSAGIRNLIEQPVAEPSQRIRELTCHVLRSLGLDWREATRLASIE